MIIKNSNVWLKQDSVMLEENLVLIGRWFWKWPCAGLDCCYNWECEWSGPLGAPGQWWEQARSDHITGCISRNQGGGWQWRAWKEPLILPPGLGSAKTLSASFSREFIARMYLPPSNSVRFYGLAPAGCLKAKCSDELAWVAWESTAQSSWDVESQLNVLISSVWLQISSDGSLKHPVSFPSLSSYAF